MLTHNSGYWLGISNDLLGESRRLRARAKRIEEDKRIGGGDHRQGRVEWLKARADEACKLGTEVYEALRVAADHYEYSSEWDHGANFPPDEAVIGWWRFQGLQWCSVWHALGVRAAAIRGDGTRPERGRHARTVAHSGAEPSSRP